MKLFVKTLIGILVVVIILLGTGTLYIVHEDKQVIITRLGKPVGEPIREPGIYYKIPFYDKAIFLEKRILIWDGDANRIPTKEKNLIWVDTTARWKIADPLRFLNSVQDVVNAHQKIDGIIDSNTKNIISQVNLVEVVRNTNRILEIINSKDGEDVLEDELSSNVESIETGREKISNLILEGSNLKLKELGIEVIDIQLKRVLYEDQVLKKVFDRMISERRRIAEKYKSEGKGERSKIEGRLARDLKIIETTAYRKAQEIKGKGEAEAINIYAKSLGQDPKFYEFMRTMDAYKKSIKGNTKFILSSDSEFLRFFKNIK